MTFDQRSDLFGVMEHCYRCGNLSPFDDWLKEQGLKIVPVRPDNKEE